MKYIQRRIVSTVFDSSTQRRCSKLLILSLLAQENVAFPDEIA